MADTTADADRPLHHHVSSTKGPSLTGRFTRFHVREESASVQTGAAGIRELRLSRREFEDASAKISRGHGAIEHIGSILESAIAINLHRTNRPIFAYLFAKK